MKIKIRRETPEDLQAIHEVTAAAFQEAPHSDQTEPFIIQALREAGALTLSLVADNGEKVIGHVAISPVVISDGSTGWYGLGPISVLPQEQGKGIGSRLMKAVLSELKSLQARGCVLLGDPNYYQRFGFEPVVGLILPDVPPEYFQALLLKGSYPRGVVSYHAAFSVS